MAVFKQKEINLRAGCGDRRLNKFFDQSHSNTADEIVMRNGAGNIKGAQNTIERHIRENLRSDGTTRVSRLVSEAHSDCGAMGMVLDSLMDKERAYIQIREFTNQYNNFEVDKGISREKNLMNLEHFHMDKQRENAYALLRQIQIRTGIDTSRISVETKLIDTHRHDETEKQADYKNLKYVGVVDVSFLNAKFIDVIDQIKNGNEFFTYFFNLDPEDCVIAGLKVFARLGVKDWVVPYESNANISKALERSAQIMEIVLPIQRESNVSPLNVKPTNIREIEKPQIFGSTKLTARMG
ncbi:MAG: hypothetical protein KGH71_03245 [Candidatus Micrarchaeota archaeon]|nr:hypothetical protein [Candidatus Micrarchaeota archaeon]